MLDYFLGRHPDLKVSISDLTLRSNYFSYVVNINSPWLHKINEGLILMQSTHISNQVCRRYLDKHIYECAL